MSGAWEAHEVASYIAEICQDLKQLASDASLNDLADAVDQAREIAQEIAKNRPKPGG